MLKIDFMSLICSLHLCALAICYISIVDRKVFINNSNLEITFIDFNEGIFFLI